MPVIQLEWSPTSRSAGYEDIVNVSEAGARVGARLGGVGNWLCGPRKLGSDRRQLNVTRVSRVSNLEPPSPFARSFSDETFQ
jgi:hypothetical protein